MTGVLLQVDDLAVEFDTPKGPLRAVRGVSFQVGEGETLAIVGESGSGKSVTAHTLMGLVPPRARIVSGRVTIEGRDVTGLSDEELRRTPRRANRDDLPGPAERAEPVADRGLPDRRDVPPRTAASAARRPGAVAVEPAWSEVGHPGRRAAPGRLPAPVLRRHAPAGDDRDGARLRPAAAHRRRADHRAGRHRAGADPGLLRQLQRATRHWRCMLITHDLGVVAEPPTGSRSCTRAASSRRAPSPRCSSARRTRTRRACCERCRAGDGASAAGGRSPASPRPAGAARPAAPSIRAARSPAAAAGKSSPELLRAGGRAGQRGATSPQEVMTAVHAESGEPLPASVARPGDQLPVTPRASVGVDARRRSGPSPA